jgi:hypothetical protein
MEFKAIRKLYGETFSKAYIEAGPRLVAKKRNKYFSLKRLLAIGEPLLAGVSLPAVEHQIIEVESPWHALCAAMYLNTRL